MNNRDKRDMFTALLFLAIILTAVFVWSAATGQWDHVIALVISFAAAGAMLLSLRLLRKLAKKIWP